MRFSNREQKDGDSLRRQTTARDAWCERNGVRLIETEVSINDPGVSGFKKGRRNGKAGDDQWASLPELEDIINPDRRGLLAFLELIRRRKVPRGAYLIVENLDRLTRDEAVPASHLVTSILMSGVRVVQLFPAEVILTEKSDAFEVMRFVMELSRGNNESEAKAVRCGAAWAEKRRLARERKDQPPRKKDGRVTIAMTSRLPAWVQEHGGRLESIPEKVDVLRRIFEMAAAGLGYRGILRTMLKERVPPLGGKSWCHSYLSWVLHDRRVLGEFQPKRRGKPDGPPVKGYFPKDVISVDLFLKVQAALGRRRSRNFAGRPGGDRVNLFRGLLFDARTGASYRMAKVPGFRRKDGSSAPAYVVLAAGGPVGGTLSANSFPMATLERAVLAMLWEVNAAEIVEEGLDEAAGLEAELEAVRGRLAEIRTALVAGSGTPLQTLVAAAADLETQERDLAQKVQAAQNEAASPLAAAWAEGKTLAAALDAAPDQEAARLKLRSVLRRAISEMRMVTARRGNDRLAAVQVFFSGGGTRFYEILHRQAKGNGMARQPGRWWASSGRCGSIDLRTPERVAVALEMLPTFNPDELEAEGEWERAGTLRRSGVIGQPDDPGWKGVPLGRPRRKGVGA
jgi:DNA invertase Pin-like site-specific DNA recombinase